MFLPKVVLVNMFQFMDLISIVTFLKTCKTYYKYKKLVLQLYGYNKINYNRMVNIYNNDSFWKPTTISKEDYDRVIFKGPTQYMTKYYYVDFMKDPHNSSLRLSLDYDQITIIYNFINHCIEPIKNCKIVFSYVFRISELVTIELINIKNNDLWEDHYRRTVKNSKITIFYVDKCVKLLDQLCEQKIKKPQDSFVWNIIKNVYNWITI